MAGEPEGRGGLRCTRIMETSEGLSVRKTEARGAAVWLAARRSCVGQVSYRSNGAIVTADSPGSAHRKRRSRPVGVGIYQTRRVAPGDVLELLPSVETDPVLIAQVLVKLFANAHRYAAPGTPIIDAVTIRGTRAYSRCRSPISVSAPLGSMR